MEFWEKLTKLRNAYLLLAEFEVRTYLLLTEQEVCMGESWPRSWVQTERSEVCTHDRGQASPIQTD